MYKAKNVLKMGINTPLHLKKNPASNQPCNAAQVCTEYSQKTAHTKHSPDISAIPSTAHIKSLILFVIPYLAKVKSP